MIDFLRDQSCKNPKVIAEDGSNRRYYRVERDQQGKQGEHAILMEMTGDIANNDDMANFIRIGEWLRSIGLSAPEIYAVNAEEGLALIEDFGVQSFKDAPDYDLATDVLSHLRAQNCPLDLPHYATSQIQEGHKRVIDWYAPIALGRKRSDEDLSGYQKAWAEIENQLPTPQRGFVHADFHCENLMLLEGHDGLKRCGILDFQGAMAGSPLYDLGNLLEDARIDVAEDVRAHHLAKLSEEDRAWYRVLTTQFHCRIAGQFIKMACAGKPQYLQYLPRVEGYLRAAIQNDPLLSPLKDYFAQIGLDFSSLQDLDSARVQKFVRDDAF